MPTDNRLSSRHQPPSTVETKYSSENYSFWAFLMTHLMSVADIIWSMLLSHVSQQWHLSSAKPIWFTPYVDEISSALPWSTQILVRSTSDWRRFFDRFPFLNIGELANFPNNQKQDLLSMYRYLTTAIEELETEPTDDTSRRSLNFEKQSSEMRFNYLFDRLWFVDIRNKIKALPTETVQDFIQHKSKWTDQVKYILSTISQLVKKKELNSSEVGCVEDVEIFQFNLTFWLNRHKYCAILVRKSSLPSDHWLWPDDKRICFHWPVDSRCRIAKKWVDWLASDLLVWKSGF